MIDDQIGRMLEHLDQKGLADNTLVLFSADHGETLGSHGGLFDKGWHHFEEIQRVPLIVRGPGVPMGRIAGQWASLADLYPTILEAAGASLPEGAHGRSLIPVLEGGDPEWPREAVVEFFGVNSLSTTMITVRHGDYKYGWNCSNCDELYNLAADPTETRNLIDEPDQAARVSAMRRRLLQWLEGHGFSGIGISMYRSSRKV
jgi:arylsulfatase A-like enzyme